MSKPYYETEEYSEAENELDTYDDKVKLVMEYRISEKHKDQQITDLQHEKEIIQKALDLACQTLYDINFQLYNTEMDFKEYFKQQAKEMLENE